jgi:hypothetical protein
VKGDGRDLAMMVGVQFTGSVGANATQRWFTYNWPADKQVIWTVVPTSPKAGAPQVEWDVAVERASATAVTYWVTIRNVSANPTDIEARYAVLP